jgi:hypothetical protein
MLKPTQGQGQAAKQAGRVWRALHSAKQPLSDRKGSCAAADSNQDIALTPQGDLLQVWRLKVVERLATRLMIRSRYLG